MTYTPPHLLFISFLVLFSFAVIPFISTNSTTAQTPDFDGGFGDYQWLVLVYADGDNSLSSDIVDDVMEMAEVGSTDSIAIVALLDQGFNRARVFEEISNRSTSDNYTTYLEEYERIAHEENLPAHLYYVEPGNLDDLGTSMAGIDQEPNMGNPTTLTKFLSWGIRSFPAENTMLILEDHGASWKGFCQDVSHGDTLTPSELRQSLLSVGQHWDIIGFDACLMASVEMMYEVSPYCDYMIASEMTEPGSGWDYTALDSAKADPSITPAEFCEEIVDAYTGQYAQKHTMAVFDSGKFTQFSVLLDDLFNDMVVDANDYSSFFVGVHLSTSPYYLTDLYAPYYFYDIYEFLDTIPSVPGATVTALKSYYESARIYYMEEDPLSAYCGLSIYIPPTPNVASDYTETLFARKMQYNELLYAAYSIAPFKPDISSKPSQPTISYNISTGIVEVKTTSDIDKWSPNTLHLGNDCYTLEASVDGQPLGYGFYNVRAATIQARVYNGKYYSDLKTMTYDDIEGILIEGPPAVVSIQLEIGWNIVSFPVNTLGALTASFLVSTYYGVDSVVERDNGSYIIYREESPFDDNDFSIDSQSAYYIYAASATLITIVGYEITNPMYDLTVGWNLVPVYADTTASTVMAYSSDIEAVGYKVGSNGYEVYISGLSGQDDFDITEASGMWLYSSSNVVIDV